MCLLSKAAGENPDRRQQDFEQLLSASISPSQPELQFADKEHSASFNTASVSIGRTPANVKLKLTPTHRIPQRSITTTMSATASSSFSFASSSRDQLPLHASRSGAGLVAPKPRLVPLVLDETDEEPGPASPTSYFDKGKRRLFDSWFAASGADTSPTERGGPSRSDSSDSTTSTTTTSSSASSPSACDGASLFDADHRYSQSRSQSRATTLSPPTRPTSLEPLKTTLASFGTSLSLALSASPVEPDDLELGSPVRRSFLFRASTPPLHHHHQQQQQPAPLLDDQGQLLRVKSPPNSVLAYASEPTQLEGVSATNASKHHAAPWPLPRISLSTAGWTVRLPSLSALSLRLRQRSSATPSTARGSTHLRSLLQIGLLFVVWTALVVSGLRTLPLQAPSHSSLSKLTLPEIRGMALSLQAYSRSSSRAAWHTWSVLIFFFTWKQAFTIPGSLIMNTVLGALYGTLLGTLYTTLFTGLGGVACYLIVRPLAPLIESLPGLRKPLNAMRAALAQAGVGESHSRSQPSSSNAQTRLNLNASTDLLSYLLVLRLVPIVPWGMMTISTSILNVGLWPHFLTLTLGSVPWNYITCQVGEFLQEIVALLPAADAAQLGDAAAAGTTHGAQQQSGLALIGAKIYSREMLLKLAFLSLISLAPMFLAKWLKCTTPAVPLRVAQQEEDEAAQAMQPLLADDDSSTSISHSRSASDSFGFERDSGHASIEERRPRTFRAVAVHHKASSPWL